MAFWPKWLGGGGTPARDATRTKAAVQDAGGGQLITTPQQLADAIRGMQISSSGAVVTPETAMRVAAVFACVRLRASVVANMPLHVKRRIDDRTRNDASDHPLWKVLRRKPNRWQTPSGFRRMMQTQMLLRGNAYALIVRSRGAVTELVPLHPDRVKPVQGEDLKIVYNYTRKNGGQEVFKQSDVLHLVGMTLDGVTGVSPITYARETIGLSLAMEDHGANVFRNGARISMLLKHPHKLGAEGLEFLRASLDQYRSGGEAEGKALILEEGMDVAPMAMTAEDAQWIESRKFSRSDIAMFFGVPPHMIGDTEKSTSWGSGIDSQTQGFVTFSAEDDLTSWEETINRDLVDEDDIYARFNRASLVRGDLQARWEAHVQALQWGVKSPNEIRADEDMNPREGGDEYYLPPNTAGNPASNNPENGDEPSQAA
jgi:HK97 family phage portal protein